MTAADREARARELLVQEYEREGIMGGVSTDASHIDRAAIRAITRAMQPQPAGEGAVEAECWRMSKGWLSDATRQRVEANARAAIAAMPASMNELSGNSGQLPAKAGEVMAVAGEMEETGKTGRTVESRSMTFAADPEWFIEWAARLRAAVQP